MQDFIDKFGIPLVVAIIAGLAIWKVQLKIQKRKSNSTQSNLYLKKLDRNILNIIKPNVNLDVAIEILGKPYKSVKDDFNLIADETVQTNSHLYLFKDAYLKITSIDNVVINTVTIIANDRKFDISHYTFGFDLNSNILNKAIVSRELIKVEHILIASRHDYAMAFYYSIPNSIYIDVMLFSHCRNWHKFNENGDPSIALGEKIFGICLSDYSSQNAYYIYQYEL